MRMELFLGREPQSVRLAREAVVAELSGMCSREVLDRAALLVSELVTNALMHGQGAPFVCVDHGLRRVRIEVADDGPPLARLVPEGGGLGLRLLDKFADEWGLQSTRGDGKKVWFTLSERPAESV